MTFVCTSGKERLPYSVVNDDYCDCADGSDEPGTSACPDSTFYCLNAGHVPGFVKSSRVNDRVCDPECCDGSDEWQSPGLCPNRCEELAKVAQAERLVAIQSRLAGSKLRAQISNRGKQLKENKTSELARIKQMLPSLEEELARLEVAKTAAEAAASAKQATTSNLESSSPSTT
ncbi:hypothetical protein HDU93_006752, partial [Gonapodya sp. JEL0774]